ncbi:hypothetical protein MNBD_UNCLBAC01-203 [hydrothermal vent metagenome]|uniref:Uncharacterized protein n=1 Tax=hydrothermal vent metagenome TaxID=652676 RepID=A0A3B1DG46_9ZZZZ
MDSGGLARLLPALNVFPLEERTIYAREGNSFYTKVKLNRKLKAKLLVDTGIEYGM